MAKKSRGLAVVTGASAGIGYELAKLCAKDGFDLVIAADEKEIEKAADTLRAFDADVTSVFADLATTKGGRQTLCRDQRARCGRAPGERRAWVG